MEHLIYFVLLCKSLVGDSDEIWDEKRKSIVRSKLAWRGEEIIEQVLADQVVIDFFDFGGAYLKAKGSWVERLLTFQRNSVSIIKELSMDPIG